MIQNAKDFIRKVNQKLAKKKKILLHWESYLFFNYRNMTEIRKFDTTDYLDGGKKQFKGDYANLTWLDSNEIRQIAIARATAGKKNNEEVVTVRESTQWQLEVVKITLKSEPITISDDSFLTHKTLRKLDFNNREWNIFNTAYPSLFEWNQLVVPWESPGREVAKLYNKALTLDKYDPLIIDLIVQIQKYLNFTEKDMDGLFGKQTQSKFIQAIWVTN